MISANAPKIDLSGLPLSVQLVTLGFIWGRYGGVQFRAILDEDAIPIAAELLE